MKSLPDVKYPDLPDGFRFNLKRVPVFNYYGEDTGDVQYVLHLERRHMKVVGLFRRRQVEHWESVHSDRLGGRWDVNQAPKASVIENVAQHLVRMMQQDLDRVMAEEKYLGPSS